MQKELDKLKELGVLQLVDRPKNTNIINGRWVYKTKLNPDNTINKRKSRWVARGFLQKYGIDYIDTFAHTSNPTAIKLLFILATRLDLEIMQWDIASAFPNADLDNKIYIEQPEGFIEDKNRVYLLNKALYGLKQAARQWELHLKNLLLKLGFSTILADSSIYIRQDIIITTHIDDILLFSNSKDSINTLYSELSKTLEISNLGPIKYYLGVEISRDRQDNKLVLSQQAFIGNLLNKFNKLSLKPVKTPTIAGIKLEKNLEQASSKDIKQYQREIGSLIYLTILTRPDLVYAVNLCARFMQNPNQDHFKYLDRIWQYLNYTKAYSLVYQSKPNQNNSLKLEGYCDSDWGGDYTRKSTTGYLFLLDKNIVSWNSRLQKTIALSSCEAEYMALKEAVKENLYINSLIKQIPLLNKHINKDTKAIYTDSQSAITLAKNPTFHQKTKHIDIQYHFVRDNY